MSAPLSIPQAQSILQSLQTTPPPHPQLRELISRVPHPHASLTESLFELLLLHPHTTLPHVPHLIASTDVDDLLSHLTTLLSLDRTLLVPILGTLQSLPLTAIHRRQVHFTLLHALSVVDETDLPAVVSTFLTTVTTLNSASILLPALTRRLSPDVLVPLSDPLSRALRSRWRHSWATSIALPLLWPQLLLLILAHSTPHAAEARTAFRNMLRRNMFLACSFSQSLAQIHVVLKMYPRAAAALLNQALATRASEVETANVVRFARTLLKFVPAAKAYLITPATAALAVPLAPFLPVSVHTSHPRLVVASCVAEGNWNELCLVIRKALLFGNAYQQARATHFSMLIVETCHDEIVRNVVVLWHESVSGSAADALFVTLLRLLFVAAQRNIPGAWEALRERVVNAKDSAAVEFVQTKYAEEARSKGIEISVDVGLVWQQSPIAIYDVVPAVIASHLRNPERKSLSRALLDISVLMPVVCVSLYEAVDDFVVPLLYPRKRHTFKVPFAAEHSAQQLVKALLSFSTALSCLVSVINASTRMHSARFISFRSSDQKHISWPLFHRLVQVHRILQASILTMDMLKQRQGQSKNYLAEITKADNVLLSILGCVNGKMQAQEGFPRFELAAVIQSLFAVPVEEDIKKCVVEKGNDMNDEEKDEELRDDEMIGIDIVILSHLLQIIRHQKDHVHDIHELASDAVNEDTLGDLQQQDPYEEIDFDRETQAPVLKEFLERKEEFFYRPEQDVSTNDVGDEEHDSEYTALADGYHISNANTDLCKSAVVSLVLGDNPGDNSASNATRALTSPEFAALLLDRAAMYVGVARKAHILSEREYLGECVRAGALAMMCFVEITRLAIICSTNLDTNGHQNSGEHASQPMRDFLRITGEKMRVKPPSDEHLPILSDLTPVLSEKGVHVLEVIWWMALAAAEGNFASIIVELAQELSECIFVMKGVARHLAFTSLTTVYEYESSSVWNLDQLDFIMDKPAMHWSLRRRNSQEVPEAEPGNSHLKAPDRAPWLELKLKGALKKSLEKRRLLLFFQGMNIACALVEGCAWIKEISAAFRQEQMGEKSKETKFFSKETKRNSKSDEIELRRFSQAREKMLQIDRLLEMIGFRNIIETMVDLASTGLQTFTVPETMSLDTISFSLTDPITHVWTSLRLFSGALTLFRDNRRKLISAYAAEPRKEWKVDHDFDHSVMSSCVNILQQIRVRADQIILWYSNPSIEVSNISSETMKRVEEVIGLAAHAAAQCTQLSESVKNSDSTSGMESNGDEQKKPIPRRKRKKPGYIKQSGQATREAKAELSKARKLVPRIAAQNENLVKSLHKLHKTIGVKSKRSLGKLAPEPVFGDATLRFGVWSSYMDDIISNEQNSLEVDNSNEEDVDVADIHDGFHVRVGNNSAERDAKLDMGLETVTVNFRGGG